MTNAPNDPPPVNVAPSRSEAPGASGEREAVTSKLPGSNDPRYQRARVAMANIMFATGREDAMNGYGRMADELMCGDLMDVPAWVALGMLASLSPAVEPGEPFGYWVEQKHAEPILLREPAYIPEPSDLRKVTPLYATRSEADEAPGSNYRKLSGSSIVQPEPGVEIPASMVRWAGGDSAPTDWDGGPVEIRGGWKIPGSRVSHWSHHNRHGDIIAYTPIAQPVAPSRDHVPDAGNMVGSDMGIPITGTPSREAVARTVHECLSRGNIMAYLNMPDDTAGIVADAILALTPDAAKSDAVEAMSYDLLFNAIAAATWTCGNVSPINVSVELFRAALATRSDHASTSGGNDA